MKPEDFLSSRKILIDRALEAFFDSSLEKFRSSGPRAGDVLLRLKKFSTRGKSIRGCLCLAAAESTGKGPKQAGMQTALAMEIVHSGFLVHDDIMDNDELRRGHPTLFAQYLNPAKKRKAFAPRELARSLGICAGDIAFFLAGSLIQTLPATERIRNAVSARFHGEIVRVGLGQMDDIWWSGIPGEPSEDDIERIYRYKTSRYTFSLPCVMGGLIAGLPSRTLEELAAAGEETGIAFQLRDDELGLLCESAETGKPSGSDIRENKKTLARLLLLKKARSADRKILLPLFGNPRPGPSGLNTVRRLYEETGTRQEIEIRIAYHCMKAAMHLEKAELPRRLEEFLRWMLRYAVKRNK